ncbi:MAG: hypothetical protein J0L79_06020 [Rickettsiales bacterium]|nr:hypothetical protein [Rickettsiales bacterium]MCA0254589.1 hypothetical protein [Pseudomonadota bacterium]
MSKSDLGNFAELARIQGVRVTQDSLPGQLAWKLLTAQKKHAQMLGENGMKAMYKMYVTNFMELQQGRVDHAEINKLLSTWDEAWGLAKLFPAGTPYFEVAQTHCLSCESSSHDHDAVEMAGAVVEDFKDGA